MDHDSQGGGESMAEGQEVWFWTSYQSVLPYIWSMAPLRCRKLSAVRFHHRISPGRRLAGKKTCIFSCDRSRSVLEEEGWLAEGQETQTRARYQCPEAAANRLRTIPQRPSREDPRRQPRPNVLWDHKAARRRVDQAACQWETGTASANCPVRQSVFFNVCSTSSNFHKD